MSDKRKIIFLTSAPRTGSTWISLLMGSLKGIRRVTGEPFNAPYSFLHGFSVPQWYYAVTGAEDPLFLEHLSHVFFQKYAMDDHIRRIKMGVPEIGIKAILRDLKYYYYYRIGTDLLIKDPIGVFSSEYLLNAFSNVRVVVLVRHPCGFVQAMMRQKWPFHTKGILNQPFIVNNLRQEIIDQLDYYKNKDDDFDLAGRYILLYNLIYSFLNRLIFKYDLYFVKYEDVAINAQEAIQNFANQYDYQFTKKTLELIRETTNSDNLVNVESDEVHILRRDSSKLVNSWETELSKELIDRVINETTDVAGTWYSR